MNHKYPNTPGYKETDTSKKAAKDMKSKADPLREQAFAILQQRDATADETAAALGASVLAIRPRITELFKTGRISDTGDRKPNSSGRSAKVWRAK